MFVFGFCLVSSLICGLGVWNVLFWLSTCCELGFDVTGMWFYGYLLLDCCVCTLVLRVVCLDFCLLVLGGFCCFGFGCCDLRLDLGRFQFW